MMMESCTIVKVTFVENQVAYIDNWFMRYSRVGIIEYIVDINSISKSCCVSHGWAIRSVVLAVMR